MLSLLRFGFLLALVTALSGCSAPSSQPESPNAPEAAESPNALQPAESPGEPEGTQALSPESGGGGPVVLDHTRTSAEVRVGETVEVRLAANPTTGYSWSIEGREALQGIELVENVYASAQPTLVGSGGVERWILRPTAAGRTTLRFRYARPWEKDVPPAQSLDFTIDAR